MIDKFNEFGKSHQGISRLAFTEEEQFAKDYFIQLCREMGMTVKVDSIGNIIARRKGKKDTLPAVAVGSHLDTVYNGGRYDGLLGVVAGIEIVRSMEDENLETLHPIEVIAFSCEESSRFGISTLGSKAMIGELQFEEIRNLKDKDNISLSEALKKQNLSLENYHMAERSKGDLKAFYELHIEQGTNLIDYGHTIGIVSGIAAPLRLSVNIKGKSSHSGTTRMLNRKDALLAAAELSMAVEKAANLEGEYGTVGTVGDLKVYPGAMNVIPGQAKLKIDIRSTNEGSRERVLEQVKKEMASIESKRGVEISIEWMTKEAPVLMDEALIRRNESLCQEMGYSYILMPSGAGHDAMNMAKRWPSSIIFIPSVDGLSHHPDEYTKNEDIEKGIKFFEKVVRDQAILEGKERGQHEGKESQTYL